MKVSVEQLLAHQAHNPGNISTADRIAAIEQLQSEIDSHYADAPPGPAELKAREDNDKVEAMLADLKRTKPDDFERVRKLPFVDQVKLAGKK